MAKELDTFPERPGGRRIAGESFYNRFLDGKIWKLKRGEDFHCTTESARASAWKAAKVMGVSVQTAIQGDFLVIQAVSETGDSR